MRYNIIKLFGTKESGNLLKDKLENNGLIKVRPVYSMVVIGNVKAEK